MISSVWFGREGHSEGGVARPNHTRLGGQQRNLYQPYPRSVIRLLGYFVYSNINGAVPDTTLGAPSTYSSTIYLYESTTTIISTAPTAAAVGAQIGCRWGRN